MDTLLNMKSELSRDDFNSRPFPNVNGYHSKTIAYSIWHIFKIEDIVTNSLINNTEEVFSGYQDRIGTSIRSTGNELRGEQITEFSKEINLDVLYEYAGEVKESTNKLLKSLTYKDLRKKFNETDKERLKKLNVVDESASWLIDYWCKKDILGLIKMPFSRHWIMHIEACIRIKDKILSLKKINLIDDFNYLIMN